jgi:hypothetical protein
MAVFFINHIWRPCEWIPATKTNPAFPNHAAAMSHRDAQRVLIIAVLPSGRIFEKFFISK